MSDEAKDRRSSERSRRRVRTVRAVEAPAVEPVAPVSPAASATRGRRAATPPSDREAVLSANAMFYRAFEVRDIELMGQLWANAPHVRCIHPGWEPLFGWNEVVGSWAQIFDGLEDLRFELADVSVRVGGNLAWVELSEMLEAMHKGQPARSQVLSTNLFERQADGRWRMIHHHASPVMVRQQTPRRGGNPLH